MRWVGHGWPARYTAAPDEEKYAMRAALGWITFCVGLGLIYMSRRAVWDHETGAWKNRRSPGTTDWRWAVPGIIITLAGMIVLG